MNTLLVIALINYFREGGTNTVEDEQKNSSCLDVSSVNRDRAMSYFLMGVALEDKELQEYAALYSLITLISGQSNARGTIPRSCL